MTGPAYAELGCATNFSFLHGASHASDLVARALDLGLAGIGIADRNTVSGVVRAWSALKRAHEAAATAGVPPPALRVVSGARLVFADGTPDMLAYPEDRAGWGRLCRLLSTGNLRADKGDCVLGLDDLLAHLDGLLLIVLPTGTRREGDGVAREEENWTILPEDPSPLVGEGGARRAAVGGRGGDGEGNVLPFRSPTRASGPPDPTPYPGPSGADPADEHPHGGTGKVVPLPLAPRPLLARTLATLAAAAPGRVWLGTPMPRAGRDRRRLAALARLAGQAGTPLLATNDVLYAEAADRAFQDILTAIRLGTTVDAAGRALEANAERHLKQGAEMVRLFRDQPQTIAETIRFLGRIRFDLAQLRYEYPHEPVPPGWAPHRWLQHLAVAAARTRWPAGVPAKALAMLAEEFRLIRRHRIAYYFLTVHDLVRFAQTQEPPILCQGRGSAANSMVCFLLGITAVDPAEHNLLFSRFLSDERHEPPDIDVDFEHERREEVMQYIYRRYGRHRAGIVATVIHYRSRSAVREVGKVLGLTDDVTSRLVSTVWGSFSKRMEPERFRETGFSLDNPEIARLNHFVGRLLDSEHGFPRHLSQHVGGFVLSEGRLDEIVPVHHGAMANRTFIEWDKDDIDALRLMKVDVLALGMLTCIAKAFALIRDDGGPAYTLDGVPPDDADTYRMLQAGDSIGVFQVESRAQINMLPRLKPKEFYDLVVQVAIVRPGPIQGDMVHPYLRRRAELEAPEYPSPHPDHGPPDELRQLLGRTFGVPLFQEQAMKLAITAAGFSGAEANQLRRVMATFRHVGGMNKLQEKLVGGMVRRGYRKDFAERCYKQIEGFGSYGFPESHALSFARLVYVSAYLKRHHPAAFCAALLNSQPMGFYAPAQLVGCARAHGVAVLPVDVSHSGWDNRLEGHAGTTGVRLGTRQVDGFREGWAAALPFAAGPGAGGVAELARRLPVKALRLLADADAFRSLGLDRRQALWEVRRLPGATLPLFAAIEARDLGDEPDAGLPDMPMSEHVAADYQTARLSLKAHPLSFLRPLFAAEGVRSAAELGRLPDGARAKAAGVVLVRQRPGKGNAVFVTLEDETGVVNVLLWARDFERHRAAVMAARLLEVRGVVQRSPEQVTHLLATHVVDRTAELARLSSNHVPTLALSRADVFAHSNYGPQGTGNRPDNARRHPRDHRILPPSRDFH